MSTRACVFVCVSMSGSVYKCQFDCVYMFVCGCGSFWLCLRVCVCLYVSLAVFTFLCLGVCVRARACVRACVRARVRACVRVCVMGTVINSATCPKLKAVGEAKHTNHRPQRCGDPAGGSRAPRAPGSPQR